MAQQLPVSIYGAVNRDGTLLGTQLGDASLDAVADLSFVHSFSGTLDGLAFSAVADIFYAIDGGGTQIIAFDTKTYAELYRLNIGETLPPYYAGYPVGTLVASQDGKYLALATPSGIRLINVAGEVTSPAPVFTQPTDMVFNHAGTYLYIATATGFVWPFNMLSRQFETPFDVGGPVSAWISRPMILS